MKIYICIRGFYWKNPFRPMEDQKGPRRIIWPRLVPGVLSGILFYFFHSPPTLYTTYAPFFPFSSSHLFFPLRLQCSSSLFVVPFFIQDTIFGAFSYFFTPSKCLLVSFLPPSLWHTWMVMEGFVLLIIHQPSTAIALRIKVNHVAILLMFQFVL